MNKARSFAFALAFVISACAVYDQKLIGDGSDLGAGGTQLSEGGMGGAGVPASSAGRAAGVVGGASSKGGNASAAGGADEPSAGTTGAGAVGGSASGASSVGASGVGGVLNAGGGGTGGASLAGAAGVGGVWHPAGGAGGSAAGMSAGGASAGTSAGGSSPGGAGGSSAGMSAGGSSAGGSAGGSSAGTSAGGASAGTSAGGTAGLSSGGSSMGGAGSGGVATGGMSGAGGTPGGDALVDNMQHVTATYANPPFAGSWSRVASGDMVWASSDVPAMFHKRSDSSTNMSLRVSASCPASGNCAADPSEVEVIVTLNNGAAVDLSGYTGVSFYINRVAGTGAILRVAFEDGPSHSGSTSCNGTQPDCGRESENYVVPNPYTVSSGTWTKYQMPFSSFGKACGWMCTR